MHTQIMEADVERYQRDGFLIREQFLDPEELETWRLVVDRVVAQRTGPDIDAFRREAPLGKVIVQTINLWKDSPALKELILSRELGEMATKLARVHGVRVCHDQAITKHPGDGALAWHQDLPYYPHSNRSGITAWIALDDATVENGCLHYIAGSHLAPELARVDPAGSEDIFDLAPEWRQHSITAAALPAGGVVFHNDLTFHSSPPNRSKDEMRRAMAIAMMPVGSTFNGRWVERLLPDYKPEPGESLDIEKYFPLILHDLAQAM